MDSVYKKAPTFLYNSEGDSKIFKTQEEVDTAWKEGWYGPPWLVEDKPLLSTLEYATKKEMDEAVDADPRYLHLSLNLKKSTEQLFETLKKFELENINPE